MAAKQLKHMFFYTSFKNPAIFLAASLLVLCVCVRPAAGVDSSDVSCPGLRERLLDAAELAKRQGSWPDDASMYDHADSSWTRITRFLPATNATSSTPLAAIPAPNTPECRDDAYAEGDFPCIKCLDRIFTVDGDTVAFTIGRGAELCSEAPRMRWRTRAGMSHEIALPPLYNWNVAALWCAGKYLIMGLEASYEYGESNETVAFWNLDTGQFSIYPYGTSHLPISDYLPNWTHTTVTSTGTTVVLGSTQSALAFWPEVKHWSILDLGTGRAIPDPVHEVATPKFVPASVEKALRKAIPQAIGFTPVKACEIDGITVVVYRADAQRVFSQNRWFDRVEGYSVARLEAGELNGALLGIVVDPYLLPEPDNVVFRGYWNGNLVVHFGGDKGSRVERFRLR